MVAALDRLPPEIVQQITKSLKVVDLASLTFVNKRLCQIIGSGPWENLRSNNPDYSDRNDFVRRLARDLDDWVYCITCSTLHPSTLIPSLRQAVEGDDFDLVGAPNLFEYFRIYEKHIRGGLDRGYLGKPAGCCLEIPRETYPPSPSRALTRSEREALEGIYQIIIVTAQHEPFDYDRYASASAPQFHLAWNSTFGFTFSKSKNETLDLVNVIQNNGFRICSHLAWGNNDKEPDPKLPDVNNFAWGRFQLPGSEGELRYITCPYCETRFDIRFHRQPLTRSLDDNRVHVHEQGMSSGFSITVMKSWTLRKTVTGRMGKLYLGKESFYVKRSASQGKKSGNAQRASECRCM